MNTKNDIKEQFKRSLICFEESTGLHICFRSLGPPYTDEDKLGVFSYYNQHNNNFCVRIKSRNSRKCRYSCCNQVFSRCHKEEFYFENVCHAHAHELIYPIYNHENLAAVLYIGPFKRKKKGRLDLPLKTDQDIDTIHNLACILKSFITDTADKLDRIQRLNEHSRLYQIESFIDRNIQMDPVLTDLADHLNLSQSRSSHLVKELTGTSFRELKESRRLKLAKDLLLNTYSEIQWVASQCGFNDINYFSRYFKQKVSVSPSKYRTTYQTNIDI